ncbi:MAG: cystathionine beta-lyase [Bacilli bacterium]|nr:cystathionine beta-lyase [Bacilli bacterium]
MSYNFDRKINRYNTNSYKWDQSQKLFGDKDILPLWVADMDFESPPAVKEILNERAKHGIYGYTIITEGYLNAITSWFQRRHHWVLDPKWLIDTPSVVTALSLAVELFSEPGSSVIVQSPVYYPFYSVISMNDRKVANNPLIIRNGRYEMDYENLEEWMKAGSKLMLLCSPHNPGGRVWERNELMRLGELCQQYGVMVVSDEIHCDLVFTGKNHIPFASLSEEFAQNSLICLAPTKTFNMPGLQSSFVAISNAKIREKFAHRIKSLNLHMTNFFAPDAVQAAYDHGEVWLDELLIYLQGNIDYTMNFIAEQLPVLKPMRPEGTYLLWIDCRGLNRDTASLKELMFGKAKVAFSEGSIFGLEGRGFLRINLACPQSVLREALDRFSHAVQQLVN